MAETLGAEVVGNAVLGDQLQARVDGGVIAGQLRQAQGKAVGRMRAALQFALVAADLEDLEGVVFCAAHIRVGLARQLHAEPLAGQRLTILEPGIADGAQRHAGSLGDTARGFFGVQAALFDPQPQVLTVAGQRDIQHFVDLEIFSRGFQHRAAQGLAIGTRAQQFQIIHARSNKATECTAMPSSRPVNPSFSVVVAFTLT